MNSPDPVAGSTSFADTLNDMPGIVIGDAESGSAFVAEQGAQVISWRDQAGRERFYLSPASDGMTRSDRSDTRAIRGGMPISFPQFSGRGALPKHGFVRNMPWRPARPGAMQTGNYAIALICRDDTHSQRIWPQGFAAMVTAEVQLNRLSVTFSVANTGDTAWEFTAALHTYFRVDDIRNVRLNGLQDISYQDATADNVIVVQKERDLTIAQEVDRVYLSPPKKLTLLEPGVSPLQIEQQGFEESVIWNPGPIKAAELSDFPDTDWLRMLCVEAACAVTPVRLNPGQSWVGSQILTVLA